ncbi:MAG: iron chelate uptake ABC transporter family permease subunit, partial [Flavobacteriaceae bacterium]
NAIKNCNKTSMPKSFYLHGPYVLGISSGASLGVALLLMGSSWLGGWFIFSEVGLRWAIMIAATLGSFLVFCLILVAAVRLNNSTSLLILGLMFGSLTAAIVNILMFFGSKEALQKYVFWSFGSLGNINASELKILSFILLLGLSIAVYSIKNLNSLLLGENYAQSLGVSLKKNRYLLILSSSILAGATTAFVGPIGFIGLAAPHLIRLLIPSTRDHKIILPAVFLGGALLLLICDSIAQIPGSAYVLPINGITSLIGAPLIILLILRQKN